MIVHNDLVLATQPEVRAVVNVAAANLALTKGIENDAENDCDKK